MSACRVELENAALSDFCACVCLNKREKDHL